MNFVDYSGKNQQAYWVQPDYSQREREQESRATFDRLGIDYPSDVRLGLIFDRKCRDGLYDVYLFYDYESISKREDYIYIKYVAYRVYNAPEVYEKKMEFLSTGSDMLSILASEIPQYAPAISFHFPWQFLHQQACTPQHQTFAKNHIYSIQLHPAMSHLLNATI